MIQDISPKQLFNAYKADAKPEANDTVFVFKPREILVNSKNHKNQSENTPLFPTWEELGKPENCIFVFEISGKNFYLLNLYGEDTVNIPEGFGFENVRDIRESKSAPQEIFYGYYTANHLSKWYRTSQYCGACGKHMHHDTKERAMKCDCANMVFPRINPAVIVGVIDGDKILCTKYSPKHMPGVTYYALIAGFTEIGETFEETVKREVMEEVGVKVKNIRFYKSQPWGSSGDILCGFYCDLDGSNELHVDHEELSKAVWSKPEDVLLQPDDWSLTNEMMKNFKDGNIC